MFLLLLELLCSHNNSLFNVSLHYIMFQLALILLFFLPYTSSDPVPVFSTSSVCICRCCTQGICEPVWNITFNVNSCDLCTVDSCAEIYTQCSTRSQIVANCARKIQFNLLFKLYLKERSSAFSITSISVFCVCVIGLSCIAILGNYVSGFFYGNVFI